MPLIRRSDAESMARDAVVLNLGDLERRGANIEADAKARAQKIVEDAAAERERLISDAHEAGFAEGRAAGHAEGHAAGLEEGRAHSMAEMTPALQAMIEHWAAALEVFLGERDQMFTEARTDIVRLGALIGERVTKRVIDLDPGVVEAQMGEALALLATRTSPRIAVHPDDEPLARQAIPALLARLDKAEHITLETDASLVRGSCIVRTTTGGEIDASITRQLDRIVADLLPDDPPLYRSIEQQPDGTEPDPPASLPTPPPAESGGKEAA